MHATVAPWRSGALSVICQWLLPAGLLCLLCGLFIVGERDTYHRLFYTLLAAPALCAIIIRPSLLLPILREPVVQAFLAFAAWALLSLLWSSSDNPISSLAKRPLYIFMLFVACALIAMNAWKRLPGVIGIATILVIPVALYSFYEFARDWTSWSRLIGTGALDNPLLSSHIFGFFSIIWLGLVMTLPSRPALLCSLPLCIMALILLATGSRTPILAINLATCWLALACRGKRSLLLITAVLSWLVLLLLVYPESLLSRGTSYRLELWQAILDKIAMHPLIGHGFDAPLSIQLADIPFAFNEPHSFALGVFYYTGLVGLLIWVLMHGLALWRCWQNRSDALFIIAGALLVYGLGAGLTEGGGILSRPKEHWFVSWIPLALIAALSLRRGNA